MKKVQIGIILLLCVNITRAQTFDEWFRQKKTQIRYYVQQIAALKKYNDLVLEGYGIVKDGLQVVSDLKQGDFDLHNRYFHSLMQINPTFQEHHSNTDEVYQYILNECAATGSLLRWLSSSQQDYVRRIVSALKNKAKDNHVQYQLLSTPGNYQLTDDERLQHINAISEELFNQYAFIRHFHHGLQVLIAQEQKESSDIKEIQKMAQP